MTDKARDPLSVALENLRKGEDELRRAANTTSALAGHALQKPGGIKLDGPEWARIQSANEMEHHVMSEQEERERAVGAALLDATTARRSAPWRPTSAVVDLMAYASERSATHGALGLSPQFGMISAHEFRAAVLTTSGYPEPASRQPGFEPVGVPPLSIVNLINWTPTETDAPQVMLETMEANTAAETAEATAAPEAAMSFTPDTTFVHRVTVTLPVARQALDDAAVLEDIIGGRLVTMVKERLQAQVIAGNGALNAIDPGANLCGITNTPLVQIVQKVTSGSPLQPQVDAISAAITAIRVGTASYYEPSVLLIHPDDAEVLAQVKDAHGRLIFPVDKPLSPFGLLTIVTSSVNVGTPLVGAPESLSGFIRGDIVVLMSQSHADYFYRNMVQLLVEGRFGFAVRNPLAWCILEGFDD